MPATHARPPEAYASMPLRSHTRTAGADAAHQARLARLAPAPAPVLVESLRGEWQQRFNAVKSRLVRSLGNGVAADAGVGDRGSAAPVAAELLECVAALDRLGSSVSPEIARRQQLECEVFDLRTALAQARAELAGTHTDALRACHYALHDCLTSLPNRAYFRDRLHAALGNAMARNEALAVVYLDLDDFGSINDVHGREVGDELLRIVAARLVRAVRSDDMVSRLGDDQFALLVADAVGRDQLNHLAGKLFDVVSAPLKVGAIQLTVRPSIGIAVGPADGASTEALLENADAALGRAQREQAGYAFFDDEVCTLRRV